MTVLSRLRSWWQAERGFSTAGLFIIALPILVGAFGYGFDSARAVFVKEHVQGRADMATATAASVAVAFSSTGQVSLPSTAVRNAVYTSYTDNTAAWRTDGLLMCSKASVSGVSSTTGCSGVATITGSAGTGIACTVKYGVQYTVREKIPSTFLRVVGVTELTLPAVTAKAAVRARNC